MTAFLDNNKSLISINVVSTDINKSFIDINKWMVYSLAPYIKSWQILVAHLP